ncbi:bromo domain-containing protein [Favolaschia claudopus]|uniref:Bromo domain-containing protein n=1 Tax=Favolaschia claudopus TaxID=2862362 RepID=A0AAW0DPA9_9AGAR
MSRARRSKSQVGAVIDGVSVLDKLVGTSSWLKISRILGKHALLTHPKTFFTAQVSSAPYSSQFVVDLFFIIRERVEELRTLISAEEEQFKSIVAEIDEIRAGQKDEEIKARISAHPTPEKEVLAADVVDIVLKDDTPEVEVQSSTTETVQDTIQDEEPVREEEGTSDTDASIDAATPQPEPEPEPELEHEPEAQETVGIIEPAVEVQEPVEPPATVDAVVEEPVIEIETPNAPEETVTLPDDSEMLRVVDDAEAVAQPPSKPASRASDSASAPAPEEGMSTRRSSRRRPSITTALPPPPAKKRGRPPKNVEPEVEAEQESTPAPTTNEPTPAMEDPQPEEGNPTITGETQASYFGGVGFTPCKQRPREESEPVDDDEQVSSFFVFLSQKLKSRSGAGPSALRRRTTGRTEEQTSETIKAKVKDGIIGNSLEYQRDIYLMFANAMMYNRPGSDVHAMAEDMMVESDSHINTFRQTEGFVKSR